MRDFKPFIKKKVKTVGKNLLFFAILTAILTGLSREITALSARDDRLIQTRNKSIVKLQNETENTIDVLVVGDSLAYTTVSPMQLWEKYGMTVFVGSQSGQKIQESYYMLRTAFENQKPKLVILETNVMFREQKGIGGIMDALFEKGNYYFPIFRFHDIWKPLFMGTQYAEENYKGFMVRDTTEPYSGKTYMKETEKSQKISDLVNSYMDCIISLCKENGAELLLVSTPSPSNYNYKKHNSLTEYADRHDLRYIDMNLQLENVGINWKTDSLDRGDHLNLSGAVKVTDYLGKYLDEHYELDDHRNEERYQSWQKEALRYNKQTKHKTEK